MVDRKTYWAIKQGLTKAEKDIIAFYEFQWALRSHVPTVDEVVKFTGIKYVAVNYYLQRAPVKKALEKRGIPFEQHTQTELTPTQVAVAVTMMNFADTRPNDVKLDQMGITPSQYYAWQSDPQFNNLLKSLSDQNVKNIEPTAIAELTKKINQGDWNAVKYYLDTTGALVSDEVPQMEHMLKAFVEVIQRHVKDPTLMLAISTDLLAVSQNRRLEAVSTPHEITGEIVVDQELESAKRMLNLG